MNIKREPEWRFICGAAGITAFNLVAEQNIYGDQVERYQCPGKLSGMFYHLF